jgi:hypothetical protein
MATRSVCVSASPWAKFITQLWLKLDEKIQFVIYISSHLCIKFERQIWKYQTTIFIILFRSRGVSKLFLFQFRVGKYILLETTKKPNRLFLSLLFLLCLAFFLFYILRIQQVILHVAWAIWHSTHVAGH